MTREEAQEWAYKYMSRNARKTHPDHKEMMRRTEYIVNKIYKELEAQLKESEDELKSSESILFTRIDELEAKLKKYEDVDLLASIIREVDGNHALGAGALAEAIINKYKETTVEVDK